MLVEKAKEYTKGDVVTVLLFTGQEIIGTYVGKTDLELIVGKVRMPQADPQGQLVGLVPIMGTADPESENIPFERDKVVCMGHTHPAIANLYTQQTSGVIINPDKA